MLMPDKHIRFSESLLGLGSFVLEVLNEPQTIDDLWASLCHMRKLGKYPVPHSFEHLVLAVDTLYAIGALTIDDESRGALRKCN